MVFRLRNLFNCKEETKKKEYLQKETKMKSSREKKKTVFQTPEHTRRKNILNSRKLIKWKNQKINKFQCACSQCNLLMKFNFVHQQTLMHPTYYIFQADLHRTINKKTWPIQPVTYESRN